MWRHQALRSHVCYFGACSVEVVFWESSCVFSPLLLSTSNCCQRSIKNRFLNICDCCFGVCFVEGRSGFLRKKFLLRNSMLCFEWFLGKEFFKVWCKSILLLYIYYLPEFSPVYSTGQFTIRTGHKQSVLLPSYPQFVCFARLHLFHESTIIQSPQWGRRGTKQAALIYLCRRYYVYSHF